MKERIITYTKVLLDEMDGYGDEGLVSSRLHVLYDRAVRDILLVCPLRFITPNSLGVIIPDEDGSGHIVLTPDFLRLHCFQMKSWKRGVHTTADAGTPIYELQKNPWTRCGLEYPVVGLNGNLLEYFYSESEEAITKQYVSVLSSFSDGLIEPISIHLASMFASSIDRLDLERVFVERMKGYIYG